MTQRLTGRAVPTLALVAALTATAPLGGASAIGTVNDLLQDAFGSGAPQVADPGVTVESCFSSGTGRISLAVLPSLYEYGDAPDGSRLGSMPSGYIGGGSPHGYFPTLTSTGYSMVGTPGARHLVRDIGWLGDHGLYPAGFSGPRAVTDLPGSGERDADSLPDEDGSTPNLAGTVADQDRRDGGLAAATLTTGGWGAFDIRVTARPEMHNWFLNALVDWNFDGQWRGGATTEWSVVNLMVSVPGDSTATFTTLPFRVGTTAGEPWVRVSLTPSPIPAWTKGHGHTPWDGSVPLGWTDAAGRPAFSCGETEDHCGRIRVQHASNATSGLPYIRCSPRDGGTPPPPPPPPPPREECDPHTLDFYAGVRRVYAGTIPATYLTSPHTSTPGWGLRAADVAAHGIRVEILYCDIEYGLARLHKVAGPSGTSAAGWRETGTGFAMCSSGVHVDNYPYASSSGHALDRGDYDVAVEYWWGCPSLGPGAGTATTHITVIVY